MPDVIERDTNSSRPGIVIVAIIAILIVAGIAVWAVTREPSVDRSTSTTTTGQTTERYETQTPSGTDQGTTTQGTTTSPQDNTSGSANSDSTGY